MKNLVVILDNGHGIDTNGKCAPDKSLYEWQWCRDVVKHIYEKLKALNIESYILVPEKNDIALSERVRRANEITKGAKQKGKDALLISVHINAAGDGTNWTNASGWTAWVSKNASSKSKKFAQIICDIADQYGLKGNRYVPVEKYCTADFYITKNTTCPAVLTENMFQDNEKDVKFLLSNEGKQKIVDLHINAIKKYSSLC